MTPAPQHFPPLRSSPCPNAHPTCHHATRQGPPKHDTHATAGAYPPYPLGFHFIHHFMAPCTPPVGSRCMPATFALACRASLDPAPNQVMARTPLTYTRTASSQKRTPLCFLSSDPSCAALRHSGTPGNPAPRLLFSLLLHIRLVPACSYVVCPSDELRFRTPAPTRSLPSACLRFSMPIFLPSALPCACNNRTMTLCGLVPAGIPCLPSWAATRAATARLLPATAYSTHFPRRSLSDSFTVAPTRGAPVDSLMVPLTLRAACACAASAAGLAERAGHVSMRLLTCCWPAVAEEGGVECTTDRGLQLTGSTWGARVLPVESEWQAALRFLPLVGAAPWLRLPCQATPPYACPALPAHQPASRHARRAALEARRCHAGVMGMAAAAVSRRLQPAPRAGLLVFGARNRNRCSESVESCNQSGCAAAKQVLSAHSACRPLAERRVLLSARQKAQIRGVKRRCSA
ncbi:hypothetical protein ABPG75_010200 [Micractinium tetrahymenae]